MEKQDILWRTSANAKAIRQRSEITWTIRSFFHEREFVEVHSPTLSADTVVDQHIEPIVVSSAAIGQTLANQEMFLQTSPEFAMKRIIASGVPAIYQIAPAYRSGERGGWHNPEFSMVEWYRVGDGMTEGVRLLAELAAKLFGVVPKVRTYRSVFEQYVGCDPISAPVDKLGRIASEFTGSPDWSLDRDELLNLLFAQCAQPQLGINAPVIVTHYPATQSALAKISDADPETAERFELFAAGVELANGYNELTSGADLRARNRAVNAKRCTGGQRELPEDSRMLGAMEAGRLPDCSGCAMGLDRLVAVLVGAQSIDEVLAFPIERA